MLHKFTLFLLLLATLSGYATHLRSGEISYQPVAGIPCAYLITVTIYTNASPGIVADLNTLVITYGDGFTETLPRENGPSGYNNGRPPAYCDHLGELITPTIRKNIFTQIHTFKYSGSGSTSYIISVAPSARNAGIINIPSSQGFALYVSAMLTIDSKMKPMSSPELSLPPIGDGCINSVYKINPGAIDPDGDMLTFQLTRSHTSNGLEIPGYKYPNELDPTGNTSFKMDPRSGVIIWKRPSIQGEYNISLMIQKYHNGKLVGYVLRDMQVTIAPCNNNPPIIDPVPDTCVEFGSTITYKVTSSDADLDYLTFETTGQPYNFSSSPATFTLDKNNLAQTSGAFHWVTDVSHISSNPYQVYYKVTDNHPGSNSLTDFETNFITVTARKQVKNVSATIFQRGFNVKWDQTVYPQAIGYNIYRSKGNFPFVTDSCTNGVPYVAGYELAGTVNGQTNLFFSDSNNRNGLASGYTYCYIVTAVFPNGAESAPSQPTCSTLMIPFIKVIRDTLYACQGNTLKMDTTVIEFQSADAQTIYKWSGSSQLKISNPNHAVSSVTVTTTGFYPLKIVAISGSYTDSANIYIKVIPIPVADIRLNDLGGMPDSIMFYNKSINAVSAEWLFPDGTKSTKFDSALYVFKNNGIFRIYLKVYNNLGCPDTTSILKNVYMKGISMPNAFEPGNSNCELNTFKPDAIGLKTYVLIIWDLWGNLVWSTNKVKDTAPAEGWDGTNNKGERMPSQNYIWRMKATFMDGTIWKGLKDRFGKFHSEGTLNLLR